MKNFWDPSKKMSADTVLRKAELRKLIIWTGLSIISLKERSFHWTSKKYFSFRLSDKLKHSVNFCNIQFPGVRVGEHRYVRIWMKKQWLRPLLLKAGLWTSASSGSLLEIQDLRFHSSLIESESAFGHYTQLVIYKLGLGSTGDYFCETAPPLQVIWLDDKGSPCEIPEDIS